MRGTSVREDAWIGQRAVRACAVIVTAALLVLVGHGAAPASAYAAFTTRVVDGWTIKSRSNAEGRLLACSMQREFTANKGDGRLRVSVIAWPNSVFVLIRGTEQFLRGEGIAAFEVVSDRGPLFAGNVRFAKSELMFALSGEDARARVAAGSGWSVTMNGRRIARFPIDGAAAAMQAVESCGNLPASQLRPNAAAEPEIAALPGVPTPELPGPATLGVTARPVGAPPALPNLSNADQLRSIATAFSREIARPQLRVTAYQGGVLQWRYADAISSGAAMITQQAESARSYAARLSIRADECEESVLTLPLVERTLDDGAQASVVSMCRSAMGVTVRHVHVATRQGAETVVVNYETQLGPDRADLPASSDRYADAFLAALTSLREG
ncbi:MAG: hypothetical protein AAFQ42_02415 [Pseudomonadota bacterium]